MPDQPVAELLAAARCQSSRLIELVHATPRLSAREAAAEATAGLKSFRLRDASLDGGDE
jgi:hypothetical protein